MGTFEHNDRDTSALPKAAFSPRDRGVYLEHHRPSAWRMSYHFHPSVEVNFLQNCTMTYSFSGESVTVTPGQFCVFWAAHPHRVIDVQGEGLITNAHVSLSELLQWPLPRELVAAILSGAVLCDSDAYASDEDMVNRWAGETDFTSEKWQRLHALEIQARLYRMAVKGWDVLLEARHPHSSPIAGGHAILQFERMLRFVADSYADAIKIKDVADVAGISPNHATSLFKKMLGRTIKEHIMDLRMLHARMLLSETDSKILTIALNSGFGSLSAFYEAFHQHSGISPAAFRRGVRQSAAEAAMQTATQASTHSASRATLSVSRSNSVA